MLETADKGLVTSTNIVATSNENLTKPSFRERFSCLADKLQDMEEILEQLIGWIHEMVGTAEIVNASEQFHIDFGKVFHDDSFYDTRTAYFFDHFIFERKLTGPKGRIDAFAGLTPCQLFLSRSQQETPPLPLAVTEAVDSLSHFRHSVFQIQKLSEKQMNIIDLLDSAKITIRAKPQEHFRGLDKGSIFQGFVFSLGNYHFVSSGLVLHPSKANRLIRKIIKKHLKSGVNRKDILSLLANLQLRYLRHKHVNPRLIYLNKDAQ